MFGGCFLLVDLALGFLSQVLARSLFEAELVLVPANVEETGHVLWRQEDDEELQKAFQGQSADFDIWFASVCCF